MNSWQKQEWLLGWGVVVLICLSILTTLFHKTHIDSWKEVHLVFPQAPTHKAAIWWVRPVELVAKTNDFCAVLTMIEGKGHHCHSLLNALQPCLILKYWSEEEVSCAESGDGCFSKGVNICLNLPLYSAPSISMGVWFWNPRWIPKSIHPCPQKSLRQK